MNYQLRKHAKSDRIKWILTTLVVLLLAVGLTASLTAGFTDFNPYGWLDHRYELKSEMTEIDSKLLADAGSSPYTLFVSERQGVKTTLVYTTDETNVVYTLTVVEGANTDTYKYVVKGADGEAPVGKWVRLTADGKVDDTFDRKTPGIMALVFEGEDTVAFAEDLENILFK